MSKLKLVPVEPTPEMLSAAAYAPLAKSIYKAMLEAAPEQPVQEPVAWMVTTEMRDGEPHTYPLTGRYKDVCDVCDFGDPVPLYAAHQPDADKLLRQALDALHRLFGWQTLADPDDHEYAKQTITSIRKHLGKE